MITVLMDTPFTPEMVQYQGIEDIPIFMVEEAKKTGKKVKLISSARQEGENIQAKVMFELVSSDSAFYSVTGTSSYLQFNIDTLGELGFVENGLGPTTSAYGLLADFICAIR